MATLSYAPLNRIILSIFISILAACSCWAESAWWDQLDTSKMPSAKTAPHFVIDQMIATKIQTEGTAGAARAPDETRYRRAMLDLVGRIPTATEMKRFLADEKEGRWARTIENLLNDPSYGRHLAHELNWLVLDGKSGDYRDYLKHSIQNDVRWDQIFAETMNARTGDAESLKGSDQFIREKVKDLDKLANDVSVRFFGINISCAQCHDHPYVEDWTQETYYGMKSFFSRSFDNGGFIAERDYGLVSYKTTEGEEKKAALRFLGSDPIQEPEHVEPSSEEKKKENERFAEYKKKKEQPPAAKFSRRAQIVKAAFAAENEMYFARALTNQVWNRFFGRGLAMPLDQLHGKNAPSHPELLEWLAKDLMENDYDLRRLIRGIAMSEAYQRDSLWNSAERPAPELFAAVEPRPMNPRQFGISLKIAASGTAQFSADLKPEDWIKRIETHERSGEGLANRFDRPGESFHFAIDEALYFSNSEDARNQLLKSGLVGEIEKLESNDAKIDHAYWNIMGRSAAAEEIETLSSYLDARSDRQHEAIQQMVWALLTSAEARFIY